MIHVALKDPEMWSIVKRCEQPVLIGDLEESGIYMMYVQRKES